MSTAVPGPKPSNYKGNSKLEKEVTEESTAPKLKKIEGVTVVEKKPSIGKRIKDNLGGQDFKSVGLYLLIDVVLPKTRDLVFDLINEGAHRSIYGDSTRRSSAPTSSIVGTSRIRQTNYSTMSQSPLVGSRSSGDTAIAQRDRAMFDFSGLIIPSRDQAEEVIERMGDPIEEFGRVSVADLYDLLGVTGNGFTDQKHGWDAKAYSYFNVKKVREGWILDLPVPMGMA